MKGNAICLLPRTLKEGMKGVDVQMMKRALSMAGFGKWKPFTNLFGPAYVILLKEFQKSRHIKADGIYGPDTHYALARFYDAWGMSNMNKLAHQQAVQNDPAARMVTAALAIYNYCRITGRGAYTQSSRRMSIIRNRWRIPFSGKEFLTEDCSSSCKGICWEAGVPTPDGIPYSALQGYTGTFVVHGFRVLQPSLANFGFYGWGFPYKHMVMCVGFQQGVPLVFSWGSGLPAIRRYNYRSDFSHWRGGYARNP